MKIQKKFVLKPALPFLKICSGIFIFSLLSCLTDDIPENRDEHTGVVNGTETGKKISIVGRVIDQQKNPIPDVEVELEFQGIKETTDEEGWFHLKSDTILHMGLMKSIESKDTVLDILNIYFQNEKVGSKNITQWEDSLPAFGLLSVPGAGYYFNYDMTNWSSQSIPVRDTLLIGSDGVKQVITSFFNGEQTVQDTSILVPANFYSDKVQPTFNEYCNNCHLFKGSGWEPTGGEDSLGLDLTTDYSHDLLVNIPSYGDVTIKRVDPFYPEKSSLYNKVTSHIRDVWFGAPMPGGSALVNQDSTAVVQIYFWIKAGAPKN